MGIFDGVSEGVAPKMFFIEMLPAVFDREMKGVDVSGMEGAVLKVVFNVGGEPFGLTLSGAKAIEISEGGLPDADIEVTMSGEEWKTVLTGSLGNALDMFADFTKMADRKRYDLVKENKGKLNLVLGLGDGKKFEVNAKFAGADSPEAIITVDLDTWQKIMAAEIEPVTAFMGGKLKLAGDMPFAMKLSALM